MYSRILKLMREAVRLRHYVVTLHALEEMDDDDFSIFNVEHCILHGEIVTRQNGNIWSKVLPSRKEKSVW
ncbi:MAG: DUF4258 domain-containing protein [Nitrospina sp.]|jgi:hypothetical protein|nr:DUF4258 domain-containing protein [Nitrospina sp.]